MTKAKVAKANKVKAKRTTTAKPVTRAVRPAKKSSAEISAERAKRALKALKAKMAGGPRITKGKNKGQYNTDPDFLVAFGERFGDITFDLAASEGDAVCDQFYSEKEDSFKQDWSSLGGTLFLNPPFDFIKPWVVKCKEEAQKGANIFLLVPASVGSKWYRDYIHRQADVYFLFGRLFFSGQTTPYPKDCMLVHFHKPPYTVEFEVWNWRAELQKLQDSDEEAAFADSLDKKGKVGKKVVEEAVV